MSYVASSQLPHMGAYMGRKASVVGWGTGEGLFGTCATFTRTVPAWSSPVGAGNDPDARLLAPITQWDAWPAAPEQPPLVNPTGTRNTINL